MSTKYNMKNPGVRRILQEYKTIRKGAYDDQFVAEPLEDDIFEWHFTIKGPDATDFQGGKYHGKLLLPSEYPFKPPSLMFSNQNGRFEIDKKICLSFTSYHPESWRPSWGIHTLLLAVISFLPTNGKDGSIGSIDLPSEEKKYLAIKSNKYVCPGCNTKLSEILNSTEPVPTSDIKLLLESSEEKKVSSNTTEPKSKETTSDTDNTPKNEIDPIANSEPSVNEKNEAAINHTVLDTVNKKQIDEKPITQQNELQNRGKQSTSYSPENNPRPETGLYKYQIQTQRDFNMKKVNEIEVCTKDPNMNLNPIVYLNIQSSIYFKELYSLKTYHEVLSEIQQKVTNIDPFLKGTTVSTAFCLLYKFWTLKLTYKQIMGLLNNKDCVFAKGIGMLYLRYVATPETLWDWFEPLFDDEEEILLTRSPRPRSMTIGELARELLTTNKFLTTTLPRIPVPIQRNFEKKFQEYDKDEENYSDDDHKNYNERARTSRDRDNRKEYSRSRDRYRNKSRSRSRSRKYRSRSRESDRYQRRDIKDKRDRYDYGKTGSKEYNSSYRKSDDKAYKGRSSGYTKEEERYDEFGRLKKK
ncbi:hypothetical protein BB558_002623 [Smittium angustum]|uniref:Pre-mRNA-splicing factor 38 n=1 Tax=Smittium angustum TaxID=133377 RepID=A0A2U1J8J1_SMIAN|nr:hypothetical protein BB558_002623 [Smittium angustum]